MKKYLIVVSAALLLVLSACSVQEGTGSLSLNFPSVSSRDMSGSSIIRVSLYRFGVPQNIDGTKKLIERPVAPGDAIEIAGLQAGPGYRLAMALGSYSGEAFHPAHYGSSESFAISSGIASSVSLKLAKTPFIWESDAANPSFAVVGQGASAQVWLYAANQLKRLDTNPATLVVTNVSSALVDRAVNSITTGLRFANAKGEAENVFADQLWFNTTKGIVPFTGETFNFSFMKAGMSPNVQFSKAVTLKIQPDLPKQLIVFYSGQGMVMGGAGSDDPSRDSKEWGWTDLETMLNTPAMKDFKAMLQGGASVLKSVAVGDGFYYIATSINTFRIDGALTASFPAKMSADEAGSWVTTHILNDASVRVSIPGETISQVATAGNYFYGGTNHGLFAAEIDSSGKLTGTLGRLGSASDRIISLAATQFGGSVYAAAVTNAGKLVIAKNNAVIGEYDAMAGVPSGQAIPTWWKQANGLTLLLAGESAAVRMTVVP